MTRTRSPADLLALAASLRLWVLELVLWLAAMLGEDLGASLRAWAKGELGRAERGVRAIVALLAVQRLPAPFDAHPPRGRRPRAAPPGFACVRIRGNDLRRVTRHLFPRERDLLTRARRLDAVLADLDAHVARLARRIARIVPATRLAPIAPPAARCVAACMTAHAEAPDSS